jgi:hypothetical protein
MSETVTGRDRPAATPDPDGLVPMLRSALAAPRPSAAEWDDLLRRLGVTCRPIGAEALQQALIAGGHDPSSREFSEDLIARRED